MMRPSVYAAIDQVLGPDVLNLTRLGATWCRTHISLFGSWPIARPLKLFRLPWVQPRLVQFHSHLLIRLRFGTRGACSKNMFCLLFAYL